MTPSVVQQWKTMGDATCCETQVLERRQNRLANRLNQARLDRKYSSTILAEVVSIFETLPANSDLANAAYWETYSDVLATSMRIEQSIRELDSEIASLEMEVEAATRAAVAADFRWQRLHEDAFTLQFDTAEPVR